MLFVALQCVLLQPGGGVDGCVGVLSSALTGMEKLQQRLMR